MLSNPPTSIHARQRQHGRQNSTPSAAQGMTISQMPTAINKRQAMAHRRGLSLDTRRNQMAQETARQDINKVRLSTNITGLANTPQHHILREAQQQRIQARPGPQQLHYASVTPEESETFLISPHGTPQSQRFDASCFDAMPVQFAYGDGQWNMMVHKNHENFTFNMAESENFDLYSNDSALSTPTFMSFPDSPAAQAWSTCDQANSRPSSRRISDGIMERVSKFENMKMEHHQRPITPISQNGNNYLPATPIRTPHGHVVTQEGRPERFSEDYDESMEETIRPTRRFNSDQKSQSTFAEMRHQAEQQAEQEAVVPSPPSDNAIAKEFHNVQRQPSDFTSMDTLRNEFVKLEERNEALECESDATHHTSDHSRPAPPEPHDQRLFAGAVLGVGPDLRPAMHFHSEEASGRASPHGRRESVASNASAASIAGIVIEETRTDTGVTLEEISQHILSPETPEGKWTCLFEECGKKFGRKENIKSHVQTHLNDRQYQCPTCQKCFVRQHDLKRHAKIHTGVKPYPCECGNSFARHDALTRHRQRGMCIGAFDGVVRKVVKRGRPRKVRPDMDSRLGKSARTRKKNLSISSSISSSSSFSGYSDTSASDSPGDDYNMVDEMMDMELASNRSLLMPSLLTAPMPAFVTRNVNHHTVATSSPVASDHSYVSPGAIMDREPSHPATPIKNAIGHYSTITKLPQSFVPAPGQFYNMEPNRSAVVGQLAVVSSNNGMMEASGINGTLSTGVSGQDGMFLQFTDHGVVPLDRESNLLLLSKLDDEFDETINMYTNNDDMFFGST